MVERVIKLSLEEDAILTSIDLSPEEAARNEKCLGVDFSDSKRKEVISALIDKGFLFLNEKKLSRTEAGKDATIEAFFDIIENI